MYLQGLVRAVLFPRRTLFGERDAGVIVCKVAFPVGSDRCAAPRGRVDPSPETAAVLVTFTATS